MNLCERHDLGIRASVDPRGMNLWLNDAVRHAPSNPWVRESRSFTCVVPWVVNVGSVTPCVMNTFMRVAINDKSFIPWIQGSCIWLVERSLPSSNSDLGGNLHQSCSRTFGSFLLEKCFLLKICEFNWNGNNFPMKNRSLPHESVDLQGSSVAAMHKCFFSIKILRFRGNRRFH